MFLLKGSLFSHSNTYKQTMAGQATGMAVKTLQIQVVHGHGMNDCAQQNCCVHKYDTTCKYIINTMLNTY